MSRLANSRWVLWAVQGETLPEVRRFPAMHGVEWFMGGVELLKMRPPLAITCGLIIAIGILVLSLIPGFGSFLVQMIAPVFVVGTSVFFARIEREGKEASMLPSPRSGAQLFKDLLIGFQGPIEKLVIIGVIQLLGSLSIAIFTLLPALIVVFLSAGGSEGVGESSSLETWLALLFSGGKVWVLGLSLLAFLLLYIPLTLATWFAPQLVYFKKVSPKVALVTSLRGGLLNLGALGVYGAVWMVVGMMATLPLGLGWVVCTPILLGAGWVSFREVFNVPAGTGAGVAE